MGVELSGLDKVLKDLAGMAPNPVKERDFQQKAARIMLADADDNFATGGFGQWERLDPDTVKRKHSSKILERTGKYRRSLKPVFKQNEIDIISNVWYSRFPQKGEGGQPQRKITLSQKAQDAISQLYRQIYGVQAITH